MSDPSASLGHPSPVTFAAEAEFRSMGRGEVTAVYSSPCGERFPIAVARHPDPNYDQLFISW